MVRRTIRWSLVGILILLVLAVVLVLAVGLFRYTRQTKSTVIVDVARLRADVGAHLPLGSSRATVEKFLNEKGIPHSYIDKAMSSIGYDRTEMALIRESSRSGLIAETSSLCSDLMSMTD